ncbi:Enhancer of mRNA-decapping protein 3, partial [Stegodyphus mimosarum]
MSDMWIGSIISVDCGDVLGVFEGEISNVDSLNQTISLINVSRNGVKCQVPEITLNTHDIKNLKLLQSTVSKESNIEPVNSDRVSAFVTPSSSRNGCTRNSPMHDDSQKKKGEGKKKATKRSDGKKWQKERDEACFSVSVDSEVLDTEFDFEKNLALFDKQAVFDEINALSKSDHIKLVDCNKRMQTKYRHDENVLISDMPVLKQISVPCDSVKEYVTDSGLVVPSVTVQFKKHLYKKAEEVGLTSNVRVEMTGRAASEMVLQLLGGNHRLNPQNSHQKPTVVVLCGPHLQGTQGVNCGRHLANHCVNVTVLKPAMVVDVPSNFLNELKLFNLSSGKTVSEFSALPSTVDIIIEAVDSYEDTKCCKIWMQEVQEWAKRSKAPILCLDPPPDYNSIEQKFILAPALPFAFKNEKCSVHICDIGLPKGIFSSMGCVYSSPFGSKFIIPLYARQD